MNMHKSSFGLAGVCALAFIGVMWSGAMAKEQPVPARLSETYAAWTLNCRMLPPSKKKGEKKADKNKKTGKTACEVVQIYLHKKTRREIARFVFAKNTKSKDKYLGILRVLVDVSFDKKPVIVADKKNIATGKFTRCFARYCYVLFDNISKKQIDALQKAKKVAIRYPLSRGGMLALTMQLDGLSAAMQAMQKK